MPWTAATSPAAPTRRWPPGDQETVSADAADSSQTAFQAQDFLVRSGKITGDGWTLSLPKEWAGKVYVEQDSDLTAFYENGCYSEGRRLAVLPGDLLRRKLCGPALTMSC